LTQKHVWNTGQRSHLITVEEINVDGGTGDSWPGFSAFPIDSEDSTKIYAVGRDEDRWQKETDDWRLLKCVTQLQTTVLSPKSAIPG
jgi:hypothetical protein